MYGGFADIERRSSDEALRRAKLPFPIDGVQRVLEVSMYVLDNPQTELLTPATKDVELLTVLLLFSCAAIAFVALNPYYKRMEGMVS
jgi:hypothetical protein